MLYPYMGGNPQFREPEMSLDSVMKKETAKLCTVKKELHAQVIRRGEDEKLEPEAALWTYTLVAVGYTSVSTGTAIRPVLWNGAPMTR